MTTTPSLPDLYARVSKACPEISTQPIQYFHGSGWRSYNIFSIPESVASDLILAACVRWLATKRVISVIAPSKGPCVVQVHQYVNGNDVDHEYTSDNLTIAALLAVEAVCKERSNA